MNAVLEAERVLRDAQQAEEMGWPALLAWWVWLPSLVALAVLRAWMEER